MRSVSPTMRRRGAESAPHPVLVMVFCALVGALLGAGARQHNDTLKVLDDGPALARSGGAAVAGQSSTNASSRRRAPTSKKSEGGKDAAASTTAHRRTAVKSMVMHAWQGYRTYAWGWDELVPGITGGRVNTFGGWGITLVDSIDLLAMVGLEDELREAREYVAALSFKQERTADRQSAFEITIRHLGGLLGAYTCTGDEVYLRKAVELGDQLLPCFTNTNGQDLRTAFSCKTIRLGNGETGARSDASLAEVGTKQMEFTYLAMLTGNSTYTRLVNEFYESLNDQQKNVRPDDYISVVGLFPLLTDRTQVSYNKRVTIGADADSFYEYLVKLYCLLGEKDTWLYKMYGRFVDGLKERMTYRDSEGRTYISAYDTVGPDHAMEHLGCFIGATLVLGARDETELSLAHNVTKTCYKTYIDTATGLGAEIVSYSGKKVDLEPHPGSDWLHGTQQPAQSDDRRLEEPNPANPGKPAYRPAQGISLSYQLRPEVAESIYYLWIYTKDPMYREWAWDIVVAIERHCKRPVGYSGLEDVSREGAYTNRMESFFLAETLKYLWLIFQDENPFPFEEYMFNTEAHPFKRLPGGHLVDQNKKWARSRRRAE